MRDHISGRRYFWCCSDNDQAERVAKQRSDWALACRSLGRLQAYRDPDKIPNCDGWRGRAALLCRMMLKVSRMSGSAERCARLLSRTTVRGSGFGQAISQHRTIVSERPKTLGELSMDAVLCVCVEI